MRRLGPLAPVLLVLAACGVAAPATTTSSTTTAPPPTVVVTATTRVTVAPPLVECPRAPYQVGVLPTTVGTSSTPVDDLAVDEFTSIEGTHSTVWTKPDGTVAVALIRGALPPVQWPGDKGEVSIDGARAVAGKLDDGTWMVAWYEAPGDRCDRYMMIFRPPVDASEVEATLASMNRTAG